MKEFFFERDPLIGKGSSREEVFRVKEECCCWREGGCFGGAGGYLYDLLRSVVLNGKRTGSPMEWKAQ